MTDRTSSPTVVLAGDIGGTKTLLRIAAFDGSTPKGRTLYEERYTSGGFDDLAPMVDAFLGARPSGVPEPGAACFGVAGPVSGAAGAERATLTNLPWRMSAAALSEALGMPVRLINDFQSVGYAVEVLERDDLAALHEAEAEPGGPRAVLGAGTGLGVGLLFHCADHYEAHATEGGHADFAPTNEEQDALLAHLRGIHGRVSYERLLSGPGLESIYRFVLHREGRNEAGDPLLDEPDPAAAISAQAMAEPDTAASRALDIFVAVYGAAAGNMALTCLATGGVYIAGGIAPKIMSRLYSGGFIASYLDKGRMAHLVERMPVYVITNPRAGLLGASLAASRLVRTGQGTGYTP